MTAKPKKLTVKPNSSQQNKKLVAKAKIHRTTNITRRKTKTRERHYISGSWARIVHAKAVGVKSNMAALAVSM